MSNQKIISQKTVFSSTKFYVDEVDLELSSGEKRTYHNVLRDNAVSVFPLSDMDEIYLVKQYRFLHKKELIEAVAGFIEDGRTPEDTTRAELEEAGCEADILKQ